MSSVVGRQGFVRAHGVSACSALHIAWFIAMGPNSSVPPYPPPQFRGSDKQHDDKQQECKEAAIERHECVPQQRRWEQKGPKADTGNGDAGWIQGPETLNRGHAERSTRRIGIASPQDRRTSETEARTPGNGGRSRSPPRTETHTTCDLPSWTSARRGSPDDSFARQLRPADSGATEAPASA